MVGLRSRVVVHSLLYTYRSSLFAVQCKRHPRFTATGELFVFIGQHVPKKALLCCCSFMKTYILLCQRFAILCTPANDLTLNKSEKKTLEVFDLTSSPDSVVS